MAFVPATLQADLLAIFLKMNDIMDGTGDNYQATEMAKTIKKYVLSGDTATSDAGTAPGGSYTGTGKGKMTIDGDALEADLKITFEGKRDNPTFASRIATDIDNACKADDTVSETSTGTLVTSSGSSGFSGPAIGKFSGDKTKISTPLVACFESMNGMMSGGGNEYYAKEMSIAVNSYLTGGTISVQLKPPFTGGSGSGKIS